MHVPRHLVFKPHGNELARSIMMIFPLELSGVKHLSIIKHILLLLFLAQREVIGM